MAALHTYFIPILPQINTHLFSCRPNRHSYAHISSPRISNTTIPISRLSCYPHPPFTIYFLYHHPSNPPCYPLPLNPFSLASFCFTTILFLHHIKYPFSPPSWIPMQTCHHTHISYSMYTSTSLTTPETVFRLSEKPFVHSKAVLVSSATPGSTNFYDLHFQ